jgi:hypothetical protein
MRNTYRFVHFCNPFIYRTFNIAIAKVEALHLFIFCTLVPWILFSIATHKVIALPAFATTIYVALSLS